MIEVFSENFKNLKKLTTTKYLFCPRLVGFSRNFIIVSFYQVLRYYNHFDFVFNSYHSKFSGELLILKLLMKLFFESLSKNYWAFLNNFLSILQGLKIFFTGYWCNSCVLRLHVIWILDFQFLILHLKFSFKNFHFLNMKILNIQRHFFKHQVTLEDIH